MHAMDEWQFPDAGERSARHGKRKREIYVPHPNTPVSHSTITTSPNSQGCIGVIRNQFLYPNWWTSCTTHGYPMGHREKVHVRGSLRSLFPFQSRLCVCLLTCRYRIVYCVCNFAYQIMTMVIWKSFDFDLQHSTMHTLTHESSRVCLDIPRPTFTARRNEITLYADMAPHMSLALSPTRTMSSLISWFFFVFRNSRTHTHTHTHFSLTHIHTLPHTHLHIRICMYMRVCTWELGKISEHTQSARVGSEMRSHHLPLYLRPPSPSLYVTSRGLPSFIIILAVIDNGPDETKDFCVPALFRCSNNTHRAPQPRAGSW